MIRKTLLVIGSLLVTLSLFGCSAGGSGNDSSGVLFSQGSSSLDFSGTYSVEDLSSSVTGAMGSLSSLTLSYFPNIAESVDNLGNKYTGTLIPSNNNDGTGSMLEMTATTSNGTNVTLVAAYDPQEIDYVPGTSTSDTTTVQQITGAAADGSELYEYFVRTTVVTTTAKTTSYKTFKGQLVLSSGQSSGITLRGDVVVTGGDTTTTSTFTRGD